MHGKQSDFLGSGDHFRVWFDLLITAPHRLQIIDLARSLALAGMIAFHIRFDLILYGLADPALAKTASFYWHARVVAGMFMFLAGFSLWLAHGQRFRWQAFWRREVRLIAAAALVSFVTYFAVPQGWIFFGILHSIAVGSILALAFLRLPAGLTLTAGAAVIAAAQVLPGLLQWNHPALHWLGMQDIGSATIDIEPLFPWFGLILIGLAFGKMFGKRLHHIKLPRIRLLNALAWPGRHSLLIYLVHQPVLMSAIWAYAQLP